MRTLIGCLALGWCILLSVDKMKWLIACLVLVCGIVTVEYFRAHRNFHFFGAKVDSEYVMHFDNKMRCAYVIGWYDERKCMCFLEEPDPRLEDKTLLAVDPAMCLEK